ncbi:hypothetical protein AN392_00692 [Pseudoalteromonas sp. P1-16-1b]|uniref:hypothetical protein n=1 Tax=Pseudoalteromonas sp. P1-16-1b TaxID=1723757 RepID=UPI0006D681E4|nr:hypothetical protein [Pseudoalteromonas sp. P1-16-1b]KPZ66120.1 hypothetical protein AN392_00692 [Pseudoalteromonas sp. P1-16-1b]
MVTNKKEYFEQSRELGIDSRCPIIEHCQRRADTLALFNNVDLNKAKEFADLKEPIIDTVGQGASLIGGGSNFIVSNLCPEVSLFESELSYYSNEPVTKAQYDKYMNPQSEILETGHYYQCAEYCKYERSPSQCDESTVRKTVFSYLKTHHQWVFGTLITVAGLVVAIVAL